MMSPPKTGNSAWWAAILGVCALLTSAGALYAARGNVTVAAGLTDPSVEAGEPVQLRITVVNGEADSPPPAPVVDGLTIRYGGQASSTNLSFNGSLSSSTTMAYVYNVETSRPGRFVIPGVDVEVNGTTLRTLPVTLTVLGANQGGQTAQVMAELIVPKKSAYLGESIPVEARAYYGRQVRHDPVQDIVLSGEGFSSQKFTPPQGGTQVVQGAPYRVDVYKSALAGLKLGTLTVGPVEIEPVVQLPRTGQQRQRRQFNDPFDALFNNDPYDAFNNMQPPRRVKLQSEPVTLEIKPLPEAGKPADFSGAIGQFRLEADATPRKAQTGEPVTVRLRLSGQGNFDRVAPPALSDEKGLRTYPATAKFRPDDEVNLSGTKTFEQVVIADSARDALPVYRFNYFDPTTGRYMTLETPPVAVKIEGRDLSTPTPAPAAVVAAATPTATPTPAPTPRRAPEDIGYIRLDSGRRLDAEAFLPVYRRPAFWVLQGGMLVGLLTLGGAAAVRAHGRDEANRRAAQLARQQSELQRALRSEGTGRQEFYSAAARLAQMRAATAIGQPAASLSAADICRVRGLDPQTAGSVQDIFHRHDELAYSGAAAAQTPVPADERQSVLATLETLGKR